MKKILFTIIGAILFILPITVNASDDAAITIKTTGTNKVGNIINTTITITSDKPIGYYEYTLDYNQNNLKLINGASYNVNRTNDSTTKKISKTFKFKVLKAETNKITVKSYLITDLQENKLNVKINPSTISSKSSASDNNYLSNLTVKNQKLTPEFNKNTTTYNLSLNKNVDKITIIATVEDKNATVTGDGEYEITEGENKFEVNVTSESGKDKTYTILVNADEKNPITISLNNKKYTIVKNIDSINIVLPKGYEKTNITIDGKEVSAIYNEKTKYTLVALKDENENIKLYIYDKTNNSYTLYQEIKTEDITFVPIETNKKIKDYKKYSVTINGITIPCYKIEESSKYAVIYGMNANTGEKGWYSYNEEENTIQKYNKDLDKYYQNKIKSSHMLIYILAAATLLFGIIIIILAIKANKKRK